MARNQHKQAPANADTGLSTSARSTFHHGDLERAAIESARVMVRAKGRNGVTLRAIASDVGVNHRAIYRYFPSLEALLLEVARQGFEDLANEFEKNFALASMGAESALARAYTTFAFSEPNIYDLMYSLPLRKLFRSGSGPGPALRHLVTSAAILINKGPSEPSAISGRTRDRVVRVWGLCHGLIMLYRAGALRARTNADALEYIISAANALSAERSV